MKKITSVILLFALCFVTTMHSVSADSTAREDTKHIDQTVFYVTVTVTPTVSSTFTEHPGYNSIRKAYVTAYSSNNNKSFEEISYDEDVTAYVHLANTTKATGKGSVYTANPQGGTVSEVYCIKWTGQ